MTIDIDILFLYTNKLYLKNKKMTEETTIQKIKTLVESLGGDVDKFYAGNKTAGTRARKSSQELRELLKNLRGEILEERKK